MIKDFDNSLFLKFIKGLKYSQESDEYTFNGKVYKLKEAIPSDKRMKTQTLYYFVSISKPLKVITVIGIKNIPVYDGFNNVKIDKEIVRKCYSNLYYKSVTLIKRKQISAEKKILREKQKQIKQKEKEEEAKLKKQAKQDSIKPVVCLHCGKLFKPTCKTQKFCSRECYHKYHSHAQLVRIKASKRLTKKCLYCGKEFVGTFRVKFCCAECRQEYAKIRDKEQKRQKRQAKVELKND